MLLLKAQEELELGMGGGHIKLQKQDTLCDHTNIAQMPSKSKDPHANNNYNNENKN